MEEATWQTEWYIPSPLRWLTATVLSGLSIYLVVFWLLEPSIPRLLICVPIISMYVAMVYLMFRETLVQLSAHELRMKFAFYSLGFPYVKVELVTRTNLTGLLRFLYWF